MIGEGAVKELRDLLDARGVSVWLREKMMTAVLSLNSFAALITT